MIEVRDFGYNPASGKFDLKVVYNKDVSTLFKRFENLTDVELRSRSVNIPSTLKNCLLERVKLHLKNECIKYKFFYIY